MGLSKISLVPTLILVLPLVCLAAPPPTVPDTAILVARSDLSPHMDCYNGGEQFQNIGNWDLVNATVLALCRDFAGYNGHTFNIGDSVNSCADATPGKGPSIHLAMKYKGESETWTAKDDHYDGGLTSYCWTAVEWALTECLSGGLFENHKYWDVKLDPNSGGC
ncbi:hypothetical protein M406DRAFT_328130 [Cryphonectria parasitica EP155]|uniref:Uncharacterized protein n=1 Tax=Cryphonectria parasitica (strain ATCC 38755 / EP155) TaxID=660469 RepID=A0A9P4Y5S2_CRYP1|nr:uncharacterized protein M406DRAFT_328130 [Cryphonectria parasitica EP155]KAF3767020.1 hypothetical protein M406DRAFT_328130 [Cryphonectria parasitica EP155]